MELRQLRTFVAVADEGGFSRAADRLHVVQSAVSAGVRSLERELGVSLFDRTTRRVQLTDSGRALLPEARAVLSAVTLAADSVAQVGSGLRGSVMLGTMQAHGMRAISTARMIAAFERDHPGVEVTARHVGGSEQMARHIRDGRLDLGVLSPTGLPTAGLRLTPLTSEPMGLACLATHRFADRDAVALEELADERFVDMPPGWGVRTAADHALAAAGVARTIRFELNDSASVLDFVREGLAVALLPPSMTSVAPEVIVVPIGHDAPRFETSLAEPADRRLTAAAAALADAIRALY